jgi:hypothetical protein
MEYVILQADDLRDFEKGMNDYAQWGWTLASLSFTDLYGIVAVMHRPIT